MYKLFSFVFIAVMIQFNLSAQKTYVFVGSYCADKNNEAIYVYELHPQSGKLTKITAVKNILNPSYVTLSPNGKYVYACTETQMPEAGGVSSFLFDSKRKSLTFINKQNSAGDNPAYVAVHPSGNWLAVGNYSGGSVSVFPIDKNDGSIGAIAQNIAFVDSSVNKTRQEKSHIHATVFSPQGDALFCPDLGADKIRRFKFDATQKKPLIETEKAFMKTNPGDGPRHFTFHPNGKFAYCIEELSGTVSAFKYNAGTLENLQRNYTYAQKYTDGFGSADIHISPDAKFLYVSNRGVENNIAIFSINVDGTLKSVGHQSTLGEHPRNFALSPKGNFLLVANKNSGDIVVFKRNTTTGLLVPTGEKIKIATPSCLQIKTY